MATFYKRGNIYYVNFSVDGRRHQISTKTGDRETAQKIRLQLERKIALGSFGIPDFDTRGITLSDFFHEHLTTGATGKAASTVALEKGCFNAFVGAVGDRDLASIDERLVESWRSDFAEKHRPTTVNIYTRHLKAAFNTAKRWKYITANPFEGMKLLTVEERRLYLTEDEVEKLFAVIDADIQTAETAKYRRENVIRFRRTFRMLVEFYLDTGLRRSEALNLTEKDIDWANGMISVVKTKTHRGRRVPLTPRAVEVLRALDERVFGRLNKHDVTGKFAEYLKRAGLEGFKLHSLRHTCATRLHRAGVPLETIAKLLGHSDLRTTMVYAKITDSTLRLAVDGLEKDGYKNVTPPGRVKESA